MFQAPKKDDHHDIPSQSYQRHFILSRGCQTLYPSCDLNLHQIIGAIFRPIIS